MENKWNIYNNYKDIKNGKVLSGGFIYVIEFGRSDRVKIGVSCNIGNRFGQLETIAKYTESKLGKVAISLPHFNYYNNESILHEYFKKYRIEGTELFKFSLDYFLENIPSLKYELCDSNDGNTKENKDSLLSLKRALLYGLDLSKFRKNEKFNNITQKDIEKYRVKWEKFKEPMEDDEDYYKEEYNDEWDNSLTYGEFAYHLKLFTGIDCEEADIISCMKYNAMILDNLIPFSSYIEEGLFYVSPYVITYMGRGSCSKEFNVPYITPKGQDFIFEKFMEFILK